MQESNDFDMPRQRTKKYEEMLKPNETFYKMFDNTVSGISEGNYLKNVHGKVISVKELKRMVNKKKGTDGIFSYAEINEILSFIVWLPYIKAKEIIEHMCIENKRGIIWSTIVV